MSFLEISDTPTLYTVYTKSKCFYCDKIKGLMDVSGENVEYISCDELLTTKRTPFLNMMKLKIQRENVTFPIVFFEGKYIGGCREYEMKLKRNQSNEMLDFTMESDV
jgi:glutaredoxin